MGKCPPGVICIENITLFFIIISVIGILVGLYYINNKNSQPNIHYKNTINLPTPFQKYDQIA